MYKLMGVKPDPFFNASAAGFKGVIGTLGSNITGGTQTPTLTGLANLSDAATFDRRQSNTLAYWTTNLAGSSGRVRFSPGEYK